MREKEGKRMRMRGITLGLVAVVAVMMSAQAGFAATEMITRICEPLVQVAMWLIGAGYVVCAITLARMGTSAAIGGRFPAPNFITWIFSVFVLSMIVPLISYITSGNFVLGC